MRTLVIVCLLPAAILPLPSAAALPYLDYDATDPRDDVLHTREGTAYEVAMPSMDVVRMTARVEADQVVQTLHFAGEAGMPDLQLQVIDGMTQGGSGQLRIDVAFDAQGRAPATVQAEMITDAKIATVQVQVAQEGDTIRLSFPASEIPDESPCFHPSANLHWGLHHAEWVEVQPDVCDYNDKLTHGLNGACPPAPEGATLAFSHADARGDVTGFDVETSESGSVDAPGYDLVGLESRREGDRIVHVVRYAGPIANGSHLLTVHHTLGGRALSLEYSTSFGALLPDRAVGDVDGKAFHVDFERGTDAVTLSFCAVVLPSDVPCRQTEVGLGGSVRDGGHTREDTLEAGDAVCHGDAPGDTTGGDGAGEDTGAGEDPTGDEGAGEPEDPGANESPGFGGLLAALALVGVALATRRR